MGTYVRLVAPEDRPPDTREAVRALLDQGKCAAAAVARELGVAKSTVCYHRRRLGHDIDERCNRRYDWDEVQRYHDLGHSVRACRARFGFSSKTWYDAVQRGALSPRPAAAPIERYLVKDRAVSRCHLKRRLIAEGHKRLAPPHQRRRPGQSPREPGNPLSELPHPDSQLRVAQQGTAGCLSAGASVRNRAVPFCRCPAHLALRCSWPPWLLPWPAAAATTKKAPGPRTVGARQAAHPSPRPRSRPTSRARRARPARVRTATAATSRLP